MIPAYLEPAKEELQNTVLVCPNHDAALQNYLCYIRWVPQVSTLTKSSAAEDDSSCSRCKSSFSSTTASIRSWMNGMAVRRALPIQFKMGGDALLANAFVVHEGLVRAKWPDRPDRPIRLPSTSNPVQFDDLKDVIVVKDGSEDHPEAECSWTDADAERLDSTINVSKELGSLLNDGHEPCAWCHSDGLPEPPV